MPDGASREAFADRYLNDLAALLARVPREPLARALAVFEAALAEGRTVFLAGNGGSAATASHMANDLLAGVAKHGGRGLRAISLADGLPVITAIANDESYDEIFATQLRVLARPGDVLAVFSGSGKSPNIVHAMEVARQMALTTVAFLGMDGGKVAPLAHVAVIVPSNDYGPIEDIHMAFDHLITEHLRRCQRA